MAEAKGGVCKILVCNTTSRTKAKQHDCNEAKVCGKCTHFYPGVAVVTAAVAAATLTDMEARAVVTVLGGTPLPDGLYYRPAVSAHDKLLKLAGGVACRERTCDKPANHRTRRGYMACEDHRSD